MLFASLFKRLPIVVAAHIVHAQSTVLETARSVTNFDAMAADALTRERRLIGIL